MAAWRVPFVASLLCVTSTLPCSAAEWRRYFANGPAAGTWDLAIAHPLNYFLVHPCLRTDPEDRIITCPELKPSDDSRRNQIRVEQRLVGTLGSMKIFDVDYFLPGNFVGNGPHLRSVVVEQSPGSFREIYVARKLDKDSVLLPGEIVQIGSRFVLKEKFTHGPDGEFYEDYFAASDGIVEFLDMGLIYEAADLAVPAGKVPWSAWSRFTFHEVWRVAVADEGKDGCCRGIVTVRFRIEGTRAKVTDVEYDPVADAEALRLSR